MTNVFLFIINVFALSWPPLINLCVFYFMFSRQLIVLFYHGMELNLKFSIQ
jgi:hypothetical protein